MWAELPVMEWWEQRLVSKASVVHRPPPRGRTAAGPDLQSASGASSEKREKKESGAVVLPGQGELDGA